MRRFYYRQNMLVTGFLYLAFFAPADSFRGYLSELSGNELLPKCQQAVRLSQSNTFTQLESMDALYCMGMVDGIAATMFIWENYDEQLRKRYKESPWRPSGSACVPEEATRGQMARIVLNYLEAHSEELHLPGSTLATFALRDAFPCKIK